MKQKGYINTVARIVSAIVMVICLVAINFTLQVSFEPQVVYSLVNDQLPSQEDEGCALPVDTGKESSESCSEYLVHQDIAGYPDLLVVRQLARNASCFSCHKSDLHTPPPERLA